MVLILDGISYRCARKAQSLLFDLCKAFDQFESRHKSGIVTRKDLFSIMRAQHLMSNELPSNITTMVFLRTYVHLYMHKSHLTCNVTCFCYKTVTQVTIV